MFRYCYKLLKPNLQYFGHLMQRAEALEKTLMLGKIEGKRRRGQQRIRWLDTITNPMNNEYEQTPGDSGGQRSLVCYSSSGHKKSDTNLANQQQQQS